MQNPRRLHKKYTRFTDGRAHPMLKGLVSWNGHSEPITFLLDSGATFSILSRRYLSLLQLDLTLLTPVFIERIAVASGSVQAVSFYELDFEIEGVSMKLPVGFLNTSVNLLGRLPAFVRFSPIVLLEHEERIVLECRGGL